LGFRRLSIIDLTGGRQPMANEDGSIQVVFNGEIYNFRLLREKLQNQGHVFRTASDTEVIVHGYEEWGNEVVQYLNGMFAFAVWDSRRRKLLLARDRLGIKPLFYTQQKNSLSFASEIKSLLLIPGFDPAINDRGIFDYFSYHFVPGAPTIYHNVQKIRPGEILIAAEGTVTVKKYWFPQLSPLPTSTSLEDWGEELRQRLLEAVQLQLVADVPLGVFLSGGLDSSAMAAAMARLDVEEIRTFNIGFDVAKYDETQYAELVSKHLGTQHQTFRLTAASADLLPKLLWHLDEPIADATIIPTYLLAQMTRKSVTVALSGEGGDELFGGYTQYQGMQLNRWLSLLPRKLRQGLAGSASLLPNFGSARLGYCEHRLERILQSSLFPLFEGYTRKLAFFTPEQQQQLFSHDFKQRISDLPYLEALWDIPRHNPQLDPIEQANLADLTIDLPEDMLVKVDRMTMACSLEARVPLLDHTLVEFALTMPLNLKIRGLQTKYIFRRALEPWLPEVIIHRKKRGFNPPLEFWLKSHLLEYAQEHKMMPTLAGSGYFNMEYIQHMATAHVQGKRDYSRQLWALLVFAIWWRKIRGQGREPS
jgi:asparagine synthase (glutamine-hydrolysing)